MISGTANANYYTTSETYADNISNQFLETLGLNSRNPVYAHQKLINMPLNKIMAANDHVQYTSGILSFLPVVEAKQAGIPKFLDDKPIPLIAKGRGKNLPMLITFTNNETAFFRWLYKIIDLTKRLKETPEMILGPRLEFTLTQDEKNKTVERIYQKYFDGDQFSDDQLLPYLTNSYFKYPALKLAEWRAALGGAPVYVSQFSYEGIFSTLKYGLWNDNKGASHMEDLTYVFRTNAVLNRFLHLPPRERDEQMVEWMSNFITNFVQCR